MSAARIRRRMRCPTGMDGDACRRHCRRGRHSRAPSGTPVALVRGRLDTRSIPASACSGVTHPAQTLGAIERRCSGGCRTVRTHLGAAFRCAAWLLRRPAACGSDVGRRPCAAPGRHLCGDTERLGDRDGLSTARERPSSHPDRVDPVRASRPIKTAPAGRRRLALPGTPAATGAPYMRRVQRLPIGLTSRRTAPVNSWRGRPIF
jgi:hypothetical protein